MQLLVIGGSDAGISAAPCLVGVALIMYAP
jgi:hypothetical protein